MPLIHPLRAVHDTSRSVVTVHCSPANTRHAWSSAASLQPHWASAELNEAHRLSLLYHRAYFTSPLPLLVPKQQPLLVYLCVFALWFSSEQHNPSPSGDWLSGLVIQRSTEKTMYTVLSVMDYMFHPENRIDLETFFFLNFSLPHMIITYP